MQLNYKKGISVAIAKSGLSVSDFCKELGVSRMCLHNWKNGENLKLKHATKIAEVAQISIHDLIEDMK